MSEYDDDDFSMYANDFSDDWSFFEDTEEEDMDIHDEMMADHLYHTLIRTEGELYRALLEGDTQRAERLQDELELILMTGG